MPIGFHFSIAGGFSRAVDRAEELGCNALQIFGRNPRSWALKPVKAEEVARFKARRAEAGILTVAVHTTYLINLSSPKDEIFSKSIKLFCDELAIAESLGADYLVTHLGSSTGAGKEVAFGRIEEAVNAVAEAGLGKSTGPGKGTMILFENSAGSGATIGCALEEIGRAIQLATNAGLDAGLCFDTCHGFAAGYPLHETAGMDALVKVMKKEVGMKRLKLIHLNDSKTAFNSRVDRHANLGEGHIGTDGLKEFFSRASIRKLPVILETPQKLPGDEEKNLKAARHLLGL
jgi:deoxyribonuclease-4